ncbi:unnamed protein product [Leptosia nina]|uniref:Ommochrome-binding protein n=1 Tax=Leptosia nina TaxID=320188 RepID=A0AAV1J9Q4_9NEOP
MFILVDKMHLLLLLTITSYAHARYVDNNCSGVILRNVNHEKEVLKADVGSPYQLAMDYDTNTLFFSYSTEDENVFRSAFINLKTNEFANIPGVSGGFANAVDSRKHIVYIGGRDGIYKFDYDTKTARHQYTTDNIWQLFYKDRLYYSRYPDEKAFVFTDGDFKLVPELADTRAMLLSVDNYENIYFSNSSGLFVHKKGNGEVINIGEFGVNGFTTDFNGNVYFSTPNAIYNIDVNEKKVKRVAAVDSIYGVAIESDGGIIYASHDSVIRLKSTGTVCPGTDVENVSF